MVDTRHLTALGNNCSFTVVVIVGYRLLVDLINNNHVFRFCTKIEPPLHFNAQIIIKLLATSLLSSVMVFQDLHVCN